MKKLILLASFGFPALAFAQTETAVVKGSVSNLKEPVSTIYYIYRGEDGQVTDSTKVTAGKYTFNVNAELPGAVTMLTVDPNGSVRPTKKDYATVYLQSGTNNVSSTDSFSNIQVKEAAHTEYVKLNKMAEPYQNQMRDLVKPYGELRSKNDTAAMKKIENEYEALQAKMTEEVYGTYIKNSPSSPLAVFALSQYVGYDLDPVKVEPLFNSFPETVRNSPSGKRFAKKLNIAKATAVGAIAPLFTQADTSGKQVSLASFKGKYVLVDFWASWCGPCRAENPNVVSAFNKYKDKNFTVLGVSLDDAKRDGHTKWVAAIAKDKLTWTHVSDLKFWDNAVAKEYGIQSIPQNLLLDPAGKIIAKNIRGEELQNKLAEVLK